MAIIPQMALASVKRFGMCFMQCKDALICRYVFSEKNTHYHFNGPGPGLTDFGLVFPPPRGVDYSGLRLAFRHFKTLGTTILETVFSHCFMECNHNLLDCKCPSFRSRCDCRY